jgi:hypothetical protein
LTSHWWMHIPKPLRCERLLDAGARLRRLGAIISAVITTTTIRAVPCTADVNYNESHCSDRSTSGYLVDLALVLVVISYGSLTLYDLLALRTIGRNDVPYRIAVLASFASYPIAHASELLLLWRRSFAIGFVLPTASVFSIGEYQLSDRTDVLAWQSDCARCQSAF